MGVDKYPKFHTILLPTLLTLVFLSRMMGIEDMEMKAYKCRECEAVSEDTAQEPLYECSECGAVFNRAESANYNHKCPDCGKFGSKIADDSCSECGQGEAEEIEATTCDECSDLVETSELETHYQEHRDEVEREAAAQAASEAALASGSRRRVIAGRGLGGYHVFEDGHLSPLKCSGFKTRRSSCREFVVLEERDGDRFVCEFSRENGSTYTGAATREDLLDRTEPV